MQTPDIRSCTHWQAPPEIVGPSVIRLFAVLLAGRDTTASTLSWTFYELACRPQLLQSLRDEVIRTVGLKEAPTYRDLKNLKYLQVSPAFLAPFVKEMGDRWLRYAIQFVQVCASSLMVRI